MKLVLITLTFFSLISCKSQHINKIEMVVDDYTRFGIRKNNKLKFFTLKNETLIETNEEYVLPDSKIQGISCGPLGPLIMRKDSIVKYYNSTGDKIKEIPNYTFNLSNNIKQVEMPIGGYLVIFVDNEIRYYNTLKKDFIEEVILRFELPKDTDEIAINGNFLCVRKGNEFRFFQVKNKVFSELEEMKFSLPYTVDEIVMSNQRMLIVRNNLLIKFYYRVGLGNHFEEIKKFEYRIN